MGGSVIGEGARIEHAIIAENVTIGKDAQIGGESDNPAVVASGVIIPAGTQIEPGEIVDEDSPKGGR